MPFGRWKSITVIAGLRTSGLTATAPFDGSMTGARFRGYLEQTLVPALRPGDTVVLDNLPAHKVSGIRECIEAAGARLLYLPAYFPDFNPIELAFAKLKAILRAKAARTIIDLWDTTRQAFRRFTSAECRCDLAAAGYEAYDPAWSDAALGRRGGPLRRGSGKALRRQPPAGVSAARRVPERRGSCAWPLEPELRCCAACLPSPSQRSSCSHRSKLRSAKTPSRARNGDARRFVSGLR